MSETYLAVKWTTSRGQDTYGYNICTLTDQTTGKRFRCNGGGYDMLGTVFGEWLADAYQAELLAICDQAYLRWTENTGDKTGPWDQEKNDKGLYGMSYYVHSNRVVLDGACGINSIETIAKAIGVKLSRTWKGNTTGYVVTDEQYLADKQEQAARERELREKQRRHDVTEVALLVAELEITDREVK